jgi:sugar (Glycoside-Pentoside-Hexuronide) transporter
MGRKQKELGLDKMGIQKTMRASDYFGDSVGMITLNVISGLVGQLTYFYTDKVGVAAGAVATILLIVKIMDAFTDLIMGKIVDGTKKGKEKCRPWFGRMVIPVIISIIIMFTLPRNISSSMQLVYILVTNFLATGVVYTAIAIPYNAMMAIRTKSVEERGKMGTARALAGYIAGMIIAILLIPLSNMLGGDQSAWIKLGVIFAAISGIFLFILYKKSKEEVDEVISTDDEEKTPFFEALGLLFKNKYWVIMLLVNLFMNISYGLSGTGGTYYAKWVLGNDNLVALLGAIGLIPTVLGFIFVGPIIKKFGMAKTYKLCCIIGALACLVRVFLPYSLMAVIICGAITTFATIPLMCVGGPMVNNCVEYNEYLYGKNLVGMNNSASSFGNKIGSGIGGALVGWLLASGAYDATLKTQPQSAIYAIFGFSIYIPLALFVIMFILISRYDLEKIYPDIMKELQARKSNS